MIQPLETRIHDPTQRAAPPIRLELVPRLVYYDPYEPLLQP
jgi:hypothetical protein